VLLLEGDSDEKLFRRFVADPEMLIIPTWGKQNAIDAVEILESCKQEGIVAIVDADFGHLAGSLPPSRNVLVTDDHDIEMMIIRTDAFIAVLRELGSTSKLKKFAKGLEREVREILLEKSLIVGHFRLLSFLDGLGLCFEGLRFDRIINRDSLALDSEALVTNVLALTHNPQLNRRSTQRRLRTLLEEHTHDDPYQICCGHDFVAILGIGLRKALGNKSKEAASPEAVCIALRLAYEAEVFRQTTLYSTARRWSDENQGYSIFK
jgi:hypothetical protein